MREILFRGKRLYEGGWVYGFFVFSDIDNSSVICTSDDGAIDVETSTVGQYTGLKDKNGTRIFEGDICKGKNFIHEFEEIFEVIFDKKSAAFYFRGQKSENDYCYGYCENIEVIGNIHDNY